MPIQNHDPMQDLYRAFSAHTLEGLIDPMEFFNRGTAHAVLSVPTSSA